MKTITNRSGCGAGASQPHGGNIFGAPETAIDCGDVLLWPESETDPDRFHFLPLSPLVTKQPDAKPHVGMMDPNGSAFFFASLQLGLPREKLAQLRCNIAKDTEHEPHLGLAPVSVKCAQVVMTDECGAETILHQRRPALHPPYSVLLQFLAPDVAKTALQSALRGQPGQIALRYLLERQVAIQTEFTFKGCFPTEPCVATLEAALAHGKLTLSPFIAMADLRREMLGQAALLNSFTGAAGCNTSLTVSLSLPKISRFEIGVDLGRLMAA